MPGISQFYRQQRLASLSGIGNLSASDIAAATQDSRELARAGGMLTEFGMEFIEQKEKAEFHDQINTAKTQYLTKFFEYEQGLQTNADTETYMPGLKAGQESSYKFTNTRASNEFELWKANEDLSQTRRVFGIKNDRDVQNYTDNWNLGIKEATRRTASAMSPADYQLELANGMSYFGLEYATEEKDGEPVPVLDENGAPTIQLIEDWENPLLDSDEVRMAGFNEWRADADARRDKNIQEQSKKAIETLVIQMGAEQGWDETIKALGYPKFVEKLAADHGLTVGDAAEFTRDMETLARSRKQAEDEAVKEVHRENEILLEEMTRTNDPDLVPSMVADLYANNQIDKTTRDSYITRLEKRHPIETVRETKYQITEAIRDYKAGDATYADTEKLLKENLASLSDSDLTTLQNSLYSAQASVDNGTDNKALARRIKVGADYLTSVYKSVGFLGEEEKAAIVPETYEWARFYGERMDQWEQFWKVNPEATASEADAFANLLTEDVWSNNRNKYLDKPEYEAVDRRIKAELVKLGIQGQEQEAVLDQKQITINDEPADYFEFLENVATIDDTDEAKAYYKKWNKGTWPKPK